MGKSSRVILSFYFRRKDKEITAKKEAKKAASSAQGVDGPSTGPGAEARMRAAQGSRTMPPEASEARLRAAERQAEASQQFVSEERLRSGQRSEAAKGLPTSVGRMRVQGSYSPMTGRSPGGSGNPPPKRASPANPFEEEEGKNPFEEDEKPADSTNPFGEDGDDDEYDESKNPFAE